jgi:hypothetical protein
MSGELWPSKSGATAVSAIAVAEDEGAPTVNSADTAEGARTTGVPPEPFKAADPNEPEDEVYSPTTYDCAAIPPRMTESKMLEPPKHEIAGSNLVDFKVHVNAAGLHKAYSRQGWAHPDHTCFRNDCGLHVVVQPIQALLKPSTAVEPEQPRDESQDHSAVLTARQLRLRWAEEFSAQAVELRKTVQSCEDEKEKEELEKKVVRRQKAADSLTAELPSTWCLSKADMRKKWESYGLNCVMWRRDLKADELWRELKKAMDNPDSALMLHFHMHYTHIYAIREYRTSRYGKFTREVLSTNQAQGPRYWFNFETDVWGAIYKASNYGIMQVLRKPQEKPSGTRKKDASAVEESAAAAKIGRPSLMGPARRASRADPAPAKVLAAAAARSVKQASACTPPVGPRCEANVAKKELHPSSERREGGGREEKRCVCVCVCVCTGPCATCPRPPPCPWLSLNLVLVCRRGEALGARGKQNQASRRGARP